MAAAIVWGLFILAVTLITLRDPDGRTVLFAYRQAAAAWLHGEPMYRPSIHGFLYLPSFAPLFAPFQLLGSPAGDLLWRWAGFALLTLALARLARLAAGEDWRGVLAATLVLGLPAAGIALQNGQATVPMFALMVLGVVELAGGRCWRAAACLGLAVALKPLALVLVLLVFALHPAARLPLLAAAAGVLLLPFLNPDPAYVMGQYGAALEKLRIAEDPGPGHWATFDMLLWHLGLALPDRVMTGLRIAAAIGTLALAALAGRRLPAPLAAVLLLTLAVCYLLLFNPRTEESGYLMLAYPLALLAARARLVDGRRGLAAALALIGLGLGMQAYSGALFHATQDWLKPALCLLCLPLLVGALGAPAAPPRVAADPG
ncbi:MAG: glycosyltransferase family 87 protein [Dongiaceae bacterium]